MITRRKFLGQTGLLAAGAALSKQATAATASSLNASTLTPWVDPLPLLPQAKSTGLRPHPENPAIKIPYYRLAMREMLVKLHRDLPPTRVWGYANSFPGPTFDTRSGEALLVEWANELPGKHFLPIDHTLHGAEESKPEVRAVVHLHGGRTPAESDGYPESWFVPGKSATCFYPNHQEAAMLFYHDHTMGINRLNIYAGLQGLFIVRDAVEDALNLPSGKYEIPLLIFDRMLRTDGSLEYPTSGNPKSPWVPEVFGDAILVNGKLAPYLEVEARKYRFRLMNGANGRFFRFSFGDLYEFQQIGSDQGLLSAPIPLKHLVLAPGERGDVLFDFSPYAGKTLLLKSDSFELLQFRVAAAPVNNNAGLPQVLRPVTRIPESQAVKTRRLTLDENMDLVQQSMGMLLNNTPWHMPVTEKPVIHTTEIWELVNLTEDSHPIHIHLVRFQILDRRRFNVFEYQKSQTLKFFAAAVPPSPSDAGWKDIVRVDPGMVVRIIIPFEGYTGRYVWHCHLLEHEDNEMMRPFEVVAS
ncbi:Multicopper oxidase [Acidisarcina polymorpha]|uniref:Multicopper oxidase n=1 Tax=Acidisarcina polymorpha TaxID=2211140 RepID=A0A2Z5FYD5_9BACT|nr:multicopper oxidase [Acidisarcina polymorpha]AXC11415.1 Multicopper oxidase [Acidisarcina polymorpha]